MVDHVYVEFGDPSWVGFWDIIWCGKQIYRQTDRQTNRQTEKRRWKPYLQRLSSV